MYQIHVAREHENSMESERRDTRARPPFISSVARSTKRERRGARPIGGGDFATLANI
jgi:hypothetical protein